MGKRYFFWYKLSDIRFLTYFYAESNEHKYNITSLNKFVIVIIDKNISIIYNKDSSLKEIKND